MAPVPDIDGWELADEDGPYATLIREDRCAKITIMPVTFAGRPDGYQATLWMKEGPHGRSWRETSVASDRRTDFKQRLRTMADEAPAHRE